MPWKTGLGCCLIWCSSLMPSSEVSILYCRYKKKCPRNTPAALHTNLSAGWEILEKSHTLIAILSVPSPADGTLSEIIPVINSKFQCKDRLNRFWICLECCDNFRSRWPAWHFACMTFADHSHHWHHRPNWNPLLRTHKVCWKSLNNHQAPWLYVKSAAKFAIIEISNKGPCD